MLGEEINSYMCSWKGTIRQRGTKKRYRDQEVAHVITHIHSMRKPWCLAVSHRNSIQNPGLEHTVQCCSFFFSFFFSFQQSTAKLWVTVVLGTELGISVSGMKVCCINYNVFSVDMSFYSSSISNSLGEKERK